MYVFLTRVAFLYFPISLFPLFYLISKPAGDVKLAHHCIRKTNDLSHSKMACLASAFLTGRDSEIKKKSTGELRAVKKEVACFTLPP